MSGAYAEAVAGDETCATPEPATHQNVMSSRSADRPEARRGPGACGDAAPSLADDDGGGDNGDHPHRTDDKADPQAGPTPRSVTESAEEGTKTDHHPQRHRQEQGRTNAPQDRPPDWIAMHAAALRATVRAATPPISPDCPQGRRVESRKRLQRFQPPAGEDFPSAAGVMNTLVRTGSLPFEPQGVWTMPRSSRPSRLATAIACTAVAAAAFTVNRWLAAREAAPHEPSLAATPSPAVHYERISRDAPRPGREVPRPPDASP